MTDQQSATGADNDQPSQLRLAVGAGDLEIGAQLQHQRRKRKISIDDAARALKLAPSTLEEIERGNLDRYESIYRRGYVRNYARFLGLDPAPLIAMLQEAEMPPLRSVLPVQQRGRNFDRLFKIATYAIVTTLIIPPIVLIYIQGGLDFLDRERAESQQAQLPASLLQEPAAPFVGPLRPAGAGMEREGAASSPVTASALPLNYIRPVRDPVSAETLARMEPDPAGEGEAVVDTRSTLVIELLDDSWLEVYAADGRRLEFDLVRAGAERRFLDDGPFRVLAGRGSAIRLQLDGETIEFSGQERADVVTLEIGADGAVRR
ncbi:MAG: helix-turn-helix domain-containing protein [Wenzhouxiangella sp.]